MNGVGFFRADILSPAGLAGLLAVAAFIGFAMKRGPRYLHMFQQDDYDGGRFLRWLIEKRVVDVRVSLGLLAVAGLLFGLPLAGVHLPGWFAGLAAAGVFGAGLLAEPDPTKAAKKPLVLTERAQSILRLSLWVAGVGGLVLILAFGVVGALLAVQALPLALVAGNALDWPQEKRKQDGFIADAKARLAEINPTVIGVTGSFGKTTVKHILGHILSVTDNCFFTPGSINTPMGVTRVIREQLPDDARFFIVEMGAYGPGSIARMCRLTPPHFGVLTAIGEAHYERFKSLDTVARAKFELPTAALSTPNGLAVIHTSVLAQPYAKAFVDQHRDRFVLVGPEEVCDARILEATQTVKGLQVRFSWKGDTHTLTAPLFGQHNIGNLVLGFATAACLGVAPERILQSLRTAPQTRHRLEVKRQPGGAILIDDAYNSNPLGFEAALDILTLLAEGTRRRILVTPGMTELGATHDTYHAQLGAKAATRADVVIVVRPTRIPTFVSALREVANGPEVLEMESFAAARAWLGKHSTDTDVVLLENDLPDLYERKLVL